MASNPSLMAQIGPDGIAREAPVIAYTEKIIMEEQLQLQKYIEENYTTIRNVERELANLNMEMKLTHGPKKAALELLRKKIETSTERLRIAKQKEEQAQKALEEATKVVKNEEEVKKKLCEDLNSLVQESSNSQFARLEELKRRLGALNPNRPSVSLPHDTAPVGSTQSKAVGAASAPGAAESHAGAIKNVPNHGNDGSIAIASGHDQQPTVEGEVRGKKKPQIQGRVRGIGAVPKGRGSVATGWTGAGFD